MYQLDHIVLNSTNVEKTMEFYGEVLDMPFVHWQEYLDGERHFPALRLSPTCVIDIFPPEMWQKKGTQSIQENLNHFCIATSAEQWLRVYHRVQHMNIPILNGPGEYFGAKGDGLSIFIRDPDGTTIEIRTYEQDAINI